MKEPASLARAMILSLLLFFSAGIIESAGKRGKDLSKISNVEWQILTKQNFSTEIRLHPHILLMVTIPWSGEALSLRKQLGKLVANQPGKLGHLRLKVIYKNSQKMLADLLGAADDINLYYYHHSTSYKYHGRFAAEKILSSVKYFMSLKSEEVPLKTLYTQNELNFFLKSTDRTVLLIELCGWSSKLLHKKSIKNLTSAQMKYSEKAEKFSSNLLANVDERFPLGRKKNQKGLKKEGLSCSVENGMADSLWAGGFSWSNSSFMEEMEYDTADINLSCTKKDFEQFKSFFSKFKVVAREFFLPPEMIRFGLISERSLLPYLGVSAMGAWLALLHFNGCPNCSMTLKEGDDLRKILQGHYSPVMQLDVDRPNLEPTFPLNRPSVVLFIDRLSDSQVIREKSKLALDDFRKLEEHYLLSYRTNRGMNHGYHQSQGPLVPDSNGLLFMKDSLASKLVKAKDKTDQTASYAQGNAVYDALLDFIDKKNQNRKKDSKISLLAKENGFQLLSDDFEVQVIDSPSYYNDDNRLSGMNKQTVTSQTFELRQPPNEDPENKNDDLLAEDPVEDFSGDDVAQVEKNATSKPSDENSQCQPFQGSFFFIDGGYRLLNSLTGGSNIPSLVLLDPVEQQHYVFTEDRDIDYHSLFNFVEMFLNGSLSPYQPSASSIVSSKEAPKPPFVNLDFHEVDAIPRVTTNTFCELVFGFNPCVTESAFLTSQVKKLGNAWKTDVLVFFGSPWCGFCQRMELIAREVYRAFNNLKNILKCESTVINPVCFEDNRGDVVEYSLPFIFLMDCAENDCRSFLKSAGRNELYPELLLYSAENKSAIPYEGDMSVVNIIKFLVSHGRNYQFLNKYKGYLWKHSQNNIKRKAMPHDSSPFLIDKIDSYFDDSLLQNNGGRSQPPAESPPPANLHNNAHHIAPGAILSATDKLQEAVPFDNSTILITVVDEGEVLQGIIFNKPLSWNIFENIDEEDMELIKQAPIFYGGPVRAQGLPLVSLARTSTEGYTKVIDGVYFGNPVITRMVIEGIKSGDRSCYDYWFFLGYSSWKWNQFFDELAEGAWHFSDDPTGSINWPNSLAEKSK